MGKKATLQRTRREAEQQARALVEDLDLDVDDERFADEVAVVHNKRPRRRADADTGKKSKRADNNDDDDNDDDSNMALTSVLPSDAHRLDGYGVDEHADYDEEEQLAVATERELRKRTADADFDVAGLSVAATHDDTDNNNSSNVAARSLHAAPVIEAVERDFAALSTRERMAVLAREAPELLPMLRDLKTYLAEVKQVAAPLHELLYERKVADEDRHLVSFLETKVQLMLSYCMHVTFYLLLKTSGQRVAGHPVVDHLVEVRVYLEKLWPLEEKLQYSLNRLLSGTRGAAAHVDELRPVQDDGIAGAEAVFARSAHNAEARERRQRLRQQREADELEREEQATMTRARTKAAAQLNAAAAASASSRTRATSARDGHRNGGGGVAGETIAPLSYREDEDQYFAKLTAARAAQHDDDDEDDNNDDGDDGDEVGMTLMDRLRRRHKAMQQQQQQQQQQRHTSHANDDDDDEEGGEDDVDIISSDDDNDDGVAVPKDGRAEATYAALLREEQARKAAQQASAADADAEDDNTTTTAVPRRKATKRMESHRGLTKARPRDRKNPRVAQRRKYERGLRVHKAQVRTHQPEPEGGFRGVQSLKPGVVRSVKLQ